MEEGRNGGREEGKKGERMKGRSEGSEGAVKQYPPGRKAAGWGERKEGRQPCETKEGRKEGTEGRHRKKRRVDGKKEGRMEDSVIGRKEGWMLG
jgi:hypothetical protein